MNVMQKYFIFSSFNLCKEAGRLYTASMGQALDCLSRRGLAVMYTWIRCVTGTYLIAFSSNFHSVVKSKQAV